MICAIVLIFLTPESPKFTFSQGDEPETLRILQRIHHMNTGLPQNEFNVKGIIKDSEFGDGARKKGNFFKFMWTQTVPLFQNSNLRNILTACFLQFAACNAANGFWTFLPEILNKISLWNEKSKGPATLCEIFHSNETAIYDPIEDIIICDPSKKMETKMFVLIYEIVLMFTVCYIVMSLLINHVGKLAILATVSISCGISAFTLIFLDVPGILSYVYILMLLAGLNISVVNASTIELFPTKMRFEVHWMINHKKF